MKLNWNRWIRYNYILFSIFFLFFLVVVSFHMFICIESKVKIVYQRMPTSQSQLIVQIYFSFAFFVLCAAAFTVFALHTVRILCVCILSPFLQRVRKKKIVPRKSQLYEKFNFPLCCFHCIIFYHYFHFGETRKRFGG